MKKKLFTLMLLAALSTCLPLAAQPDSLVTDTTHVDEIEAFSDTTSADTSAVSVVPPIVAADDFDADATAADDFFSFFQAIWENDGTGLMGMFFVLAVLFILFVLSPVFIIGLILWFIYKNRQNRMRLAEMAMKSGQPIPDDLVSNVAPTNDDMRQKGIRQIFLGIGLTFFFGWAAGKIGAGIGILVLCIGLGNLYISRSSKSKESDIIEDFK